jgi:hypothetical protein
MDGRTISDQVGNLKNSDPIRGFPLFGSESGSFEKKIPTPITQMLQVMGVGKMIFPTC